MRRRRTKDASESHGYLIPAIVEVFAKRQGAPADVLDLGCGDGAVTTAINDLPEVCAEGVEWAGPRLDRARQRYTSVRFTEHDLTQPLPDTLRGRFDWAVAVEVIEHLLLPRQLFGRADEALKPNGRLLITTPYHGYLKNVVIAVTGRSDNHYMPWADYGHVKFFSPATLTDLARECGYEVESIRRIGRVPPLAKSMVMVAHRLAG